MTQARVTHQHNRTLWSRMKKNRYIYLMILPVLIYYILFHYLPMGGLVIAFQNYKPRLGYAGSEWVGMKHFVDFLTGKYAWRVIRNTLTLNLYLLVFGFPAPILLALMMNEMKGNLYKKTLQTVSYMPHFISLVVICGLLRDFSMSDGLFNSVLSVFGFNQTNLLGSNCYYRTVYISSNIWQNIGWNSIIYLAALSGVDDNLHEAAALDGAGRLRRIWHVNIPAILPVIVIQLIMRIGNIMSQGYEKTLLLYSPAVYETADIISSYVYRYGLERTNYSFGSAVGVFNSLVNLVFLYAANKISRRLTETSLW